MITNLSGTSTEDFRLLETELAKHKTLGDVLNWASAKPKVEVIPQIVTEVITQDEFTHDVVVPYKDLILVYDTT